MDSLRIEMLNGFVLRWGGARIDDKKTRSRKMWLLLAYLICHRGRPVPASECYQLLWGDEDAKDDPQNALRVLLHRLRTQLDQLKDNAGHTLIFRSKEGYLWNPQVPLVLDVDVFQELCTSGDDAVDPAHKMALYRQALNLYRTGFLPKLSSEPWVRSLEVRYHDRYLNTVRSQLQLLTDAQRHEEVVSLAQAALKLEPFSESLWHHLVSSLLSMGRRREAIDAYEQAREVFVSNLGTMPAEELRRLYYAAIQDTHSHIVPIDTLYDEMQTRDPGKGALLCDYDFFVTVFHATARSIGRSGISAHLVLLTVGGKFGRALSKRSAEHVMKGLLDQARSNLRRGDIITLCSTSQYAILLPMANYENSCMVCERIISAFYRKFPHSPAEIRYTVKGLDAEP
ncbi:MAG: winged helix-turn-helix domain-containing protein [Ruminiclostridium sp.]|nr:winged helix-turn-helix domain-containing protein [Ruminiclostridium sp.]